MSRFFRSALFPLLIIILLVWLATQTLLPNQDERTELPYSALIETVETNSDSVTELLIIPKEREIQATIDGEKTTSHYPSPEAIVPFQETLVANEIGFDSKGTGENAWWSFFIYLIPFLLFFGFWIFLMNQMQGGGSKVMSFGKSRAKRMSPDSPKVTFKDVSGADEAV